MSRDECRHTKCRSKTTFGCMHMHQLLYVFSEISPMQSQRYFLSLLSNLFYRAKPFRIATSFPSIPQSLNKTAPYSLLRNHLASITNTPKTKGCPLLGRKPFTNSHSTHISLFLGPFSTSLFYGMGSYHGKWTSEGEKTTTLMPKTKIGSPVCTYCYRTHLF